MWPRQPWTDYAEPCVESDALVPIVTKLAAAETPTKSLPHPEHLWHPTIADYTDASPEQKRAIVAWAFNFCNLLVYGGARGKAPEIAAQCIFDVLESSRRRELGYVQPEVVQITEKYQDPDAITPVKPDEPFFWERSHEWIQLAAKFSACHVACVEWPRDMRRCSRQQTQPFDSLAACLSHLQKIRRTVHKNSTIVLTSADISGWLPAWVERRKPLDRLYAKTLPARRFWHILSACRRVATGRASSAAPAVANILRHRRRRWAGTQLDPDMLALLCAPHCAGLLGSKMQSPEALGLLALFNCLQLRNLCS